MRVKELFEAKPEVANLNYALKDLKDPNDVNLRFEAILPILETHCYEILKAYRTGKNWNYLLLRGTHRTEPEFASKILTDRRPGYLNKHIHKVANEVMGEMGLTAHRGNSIFCSTNVGVAHDWGSNVYIVFPKDGFTFTTFTKVGPRSYMYNNLKDSATEYKLKHHPKEAKADIKKVIKDADPQHTDIAKWLSKSHEYTIAGDSYIGLRYDAYKKPVVNYLKGEKTT